MKITPKAPTDGPTFYDSLSAIPDSFVDTGVLMLDEDGDAFVVVHSGGPTIISLYGLTPNVCNALRYPVRRAPAGYSVTLTQED